MTPFESSDSNGSSAEFSPIANQGHAVLSLQPFISELSAVLINMPAASLDREIVTALARIGEFLEFDRVVVTEFTADGAALVVRHSWAAPGIEAIQRWAPGGENAMATPGSAGITGNRPR